VTPQNLKSNRELFCGNSPNSEVFFDAKPDHGVSNRNQYFNVSRIRSDNDFKNAYECSSKCEIKTATATQVGDSRKHQDSEIWNGMVDSQQKTFGINLQIGTNNSDINFTRALNMATDFEKIQFTPSAEEDVFDFDNSNQDSSACEIKSRPKQIKLAIKTFGKNTSVQ